MAEENNAGGPFLRKRGRPSHSLTPSPPSEMFLPSLFSSPGATSSQTLDDYDAAVRRFRALEASNTETSGIFVDDYRPIGFYNSPAISGFHIPSYNSPAIYEFGLDNRSRKIMTLARTESGNRMLKDHIKTLSQSGVDSILSGLLRPIGSLMMDNSGNYVLQELIERCSYQYVFYIIYTLINQHEFCRVSNDTNGIRVMQKLLERVDPMGFELVSILTECVKNNVLELAKNPNGQHVIGHCVKNFATVFVQDMLMVIANNCFEVGKDRTGCCVMQLCVDYAEDQVKDILLFRIMQNAVDLSKDPFGNYVVQHLILNHPSVMCYLLQQLGGHFQVLSQSKYGSNVVEKFLKRCNETQVDQIVVELVQNPGASRLLVDPFGNYVVQSALDVSKGHTRTALIQCIVWNAQAMRSNPYGKKILAWLEKRRIIHR